MADSGINKSRRRFLVVATSVVGAVGAIGVAVPFVASWQPSARAKAAGAPVRADISRLEPGQRVIVEWRGRPVWIISRTPEMIARTQAIDVTSLADPDSNVPQQPAYIAGGLPLCDARNWRACGYLYSLGVFAAFPARARCCRGGC